MACLALNSGCASAGHSFNYSATSNLELGQLTLDNYTSTFQGIPNAQSEIINADGKYNVVRFVLARANMGSTRVHVLTMEFKDGKLNAYIYVSSFDGELNLVPVDLLYRIKKHTSTKADVLSQLGKPNGKALCPTMLEDFKALCDGNSEIWTWESISSIATGAAAGGRRPTTTSLSISFDKNGVVNGFQSSNETSN